MGRLRGSSGDGNSNGADDEDRDDDQRGGGAGKDTRGGNDGNDRIRAGGGRDTAYGGTGNDRIDGDKGSDTLRGGAGHDAIYGGAGKDTLYGGSGVDTYYGGDGDDIMDDAPGKWGGDTADTAYGGSGSDAAHMGVGNDLIYGGDGQDKLWGEQGDDSISGDAGNDLILGGDGNDTLSGGDGNDTLYGGAGDDTLTGGAGNDQITTGTGTDSVALDRFGGADIVTDFSLTDSDHDGQYDDQIDVTDLRNAQGGPVTAWDVVVSNDGRGNALLTFPEGETLVLQGISPSQMGTAQQRFAAGIPCFTAGTMILTPRGEVAVETLRPGDQVHTLDNGVQPVLWAAQRQIGAAMLACHPGFVPVRLNRGFTGTDRSLLVSPQHCLLLRRPADEVLVRAAHLVRMQGQQARLATGLHAVTYVHLMFAHHQIIWSNGVPSESFYPGPWGLAMLNPAALLDLVRLFPRLARLGAVIGYGPTARQVLRRADLPDRLDLLLARRYLPNPP